MGVLPGQRAFEMALARRVDAGVEQTEWFDRHRSEPVMQPLDSWPIAYRELVARRLAIIDSDPRLNLLESPPCKRRWASRSWEEMERDALVDYLMDRLESPVLWLDGGTARTLSVAQMADRVRADADLVEALKLLTAQEDVDVTRELTTLIAGEAVPFLAAHRYTVSGLVKRAEWEAVWALQRREDAGERVQIPVPPKFVIKDFQKQSYWSARGKLDVPKERFISYPGAEASGDPTPVIGWAGWNHLQQALALASLIAVRQQEDGWDADRLTPLLAGLVELEPWLHQWHNAPDPGYGGSPAAYLTGFLDTTLDSLGLTRGRLAEWRPPVTARGRKRTSTSETGQQEIDA